ncbi:MAG: molybdopterin oxidoreductase, partial [Verrucomicrobia bacterium]|nr:molybdopterin oxidoreductase [Verrucomicrobiota bacterium]
MRFSPPLHPGPQSESQPLPPAYRELFEVDGTQRPHWAALMGELEALGGGERARRLESARRIVREQGITYNVYGDPQGMERPWELDPLPFLLAPGEWAEIERGLVQRATLINAILSDCYGPQRLIRSGALPPALQFAQGDFLRPAHGIQPPSGVFLNLYAADLARAPDGRWWVLSDRTQIPTGVGYALANRLVTARVLPEVFRESRVQRLAGFFRRFQA